RPRERALLITCPQHAFDARAETEARRRRAAERLDPTVVPAAASDRRLRGVDRLAHDLEHRVRVIVEPAYESGVGRERDAGGSESRLHALEMRERRVVHRIDEARGAVERGP